MRGDGGEVLMLRNEMEGRCTEMSPCEPSFDSNNSNNELTDVHASHEENHATSKNWKERRDETDYVPSSYEVTLLDILWLTFSIASHVLDVAFDIYVAVNFYILAQNQNFICTVVFIVVPSLTTTFISARWYVVDYKNNPENRSPLRTWVIRSLVLLLQLAPTLRYAESLHYAINSWRYKKKNMKERERHYCHLMLKEDSDAALLRVFECFLESAPQLVLQLSILMYINTEDYSWNEKLQWVSALVSFVSLAWALASYQRSLRYPQENKDNISKKGMVFQFIWHLMIIVSRVFALSCLASKFPLWVIVGCSIHICVFFIYLLFNGPKGACGGSHVWDKVLCFLLAAIYIFSGIHTQDGATRSFYSLLYSVYFMENVTLVSLWFSFAAFHVPMFLIYLIPTASVGFFILGIIFMILYYLYFHPKKIG